MKTRLNTGLAKLRVRILKDASGKPMSQAETAKMLKIPLPTYVAYERGARRLSRRIAEQLSATWYVRPDYLLQAPPTGDPISISGEALTPEVAWQHAIGRQFGFDTWNSQHRIAKVAEGLFLNIHSALHRLSWGSYYPPERYHELKRRLIAGEKLSAAETTELKTLGRKWDKSKPADFKKLRVKGHEATQKFLFDALAAIGEVLDKHKVPRQAPPEFDTRYTEILEDILEDPEAPIFDRLDGQEMKFRPTHDPAILERFSRDTGYRPHARIVGKDGKVIEVRAITHEEAIKFQPKLPQSDAPRQPLTEDQTRALFDPVRKRMKAKGYTKEHSTAIS